MHNCNIAHRLSNLFRPLNRSLKRHPNERRLIVNLGSEKGIERASCDRDASRVVNELEEEILSNVAHCRAAGESCFVRAIMENEPPAAVRDPEDESENHSTVESIQSE